MPTPEEKMLKRYPGPSPFRRSQAALFCGREEEVAALYQMIRDERLVVLFGRSGAGKSSLLNAGLCPEFEKNGFIPLNIRLQPTKAEDGTARKLVRDAMMNVGSKKEFPPKYEPKGEFNLWETVKTCEFPFGNTPILIFDQFEELFNSSSYDQQKNFLTELAGIIHTEPPNSILNWLSNIPVEDRTKEQNAWCRQPEIRILIAIRSDRFYELSQWGNVLPQILRSLYELKPLTKGSAEKAIEMPARTDKVPSPPYIPPYTYDLTALKSIVNKLSAGKNYVETTYLQIICSELEDTIQDPDYTGDRAQISMIDVKEKIDLDTIIDSFYKNQLDKITDLDRREVAQSLIEDRLMSNNRRRLEREDEVNAALDPYPDLLDTLQNLRLIRGDIRDEQKLYEISHDVLLGAIIKSKSLREIEGDVFYENQIEKYVPEEARELVKKLLEEKMLVNNKRVSIREKKAVEVLGKYDYLLGSLVEARLLRVKEGVEGRFYGISQERFLDPMSKSRALRILKKDRDKLQNEYLRRELQLKQQEVELSEKALELTVKTGELQEKTEELKAKIAELRTEKELSERLYVAEQHAASESARAKVEAFNAEKRRRQSRLLAYISFAFFAGFSFFYFRSEYFLRKQKKSQGESISFIAEQEYQKGNHNLAFRLFQESQKLIGRDTLPSILKAQPFGILSGIKIEYSQDKKWIAVMKKDSSLDLYEYLNGNFKTHGAPIRNVGDFKFVPHSELLAYTDFLDSFKLKLIHLANEQAIRGIDLDGIRFGNSPRNSPQNTKSFERFSFSADGDILFCEAEEKYFFYSLKKRKPLVELNKKCKTLIAKYKVDPDILLLKSSILLRFTPEDFFKKEVDHLALVNLVDGVVKWEINDLKQVKPDERSGKIYFVTANHELWSYDINNGEKHFIIPLGHKNIFLDSYRDSIIVLSEKLINLGEDGVSRNVNVYNASAKKYIKNGLFLGSLIPTSGGKKYIIYIKDTALHIWNPESPDDWALPGISYLSHIRDSKYLIVLVKKDNTQRLLDIDSLPQTPSVIYPYEAGTFSKIDSNHHPLLFNPKDERLSVKDLISNKELLNIPFSGSGVLHSSSIQIIKFGAENATYALILSKPNILFELRPEINTYNYLNQHYPSLTPSQLKQYGLR